MIHYVIVEPLNGKLELSNVPPVYEVGELVPEARPELAGAVPVLYCAEHPGEQLPALRGQPSNAMRQVRRRSSAPFSNVTKQAIGCSGILLSAWYCRSQRKGLQSSVFMTHACLPTCNGY
ncbi:hypothetical protein LJR230_001448 [Trinickia sp. LjRoot230]